MNRRAFCKQLSAAAALAANTRAFGFPATGPTDNAVKNRAPLTPNTFDPLPLGAIRPAGWLRAQLQIQGNGLGGHLDETWADVGPNSGWLGGTGESWERGPYYLDGLVPLAYQLDDARLKAKAQKYIDWTLNNQQPNGMIGPRSNDDWWPRMVILKALTQYQEATGDSRVIPFMQRYFSYQISQLSTRPLRDWGKFRWHDEVLSVLWLYNRTGDPKLIELAKLLHQQGYDWQAEFANFQYTHRITREFIKLDEHKGLSDTALATHGVNNAMALKASPVWSLLSGNNTDRNALMHQLAELDRYHGLPNGIFSADEHLAGPNPSQGTELCTVVEMMYSLEVALAVMGTPILGDRLERLAYNCLPGTFTDDMWAHQYNQQPNQVQCSLNHKPWTTDGPESNLFGLEPNFGCCAANFHQGWPKLTANLWMASSDDGIAALVYAPSEVQATIRSTPVRITEQTEYPFRDKIRIAVHAEKALNFPLQLRIPAWAKDAGIRVNGQSQPSPPAGTFAKIERTWKQGDTVELTLPLEARANKGFNNSIAFERGPLVFSYPIGEDWLKLRDRGMTADWQVYPTTQWNYAVKTDEIKATELPVAEGPFTLKASPVKLEVKARKLPAWVAEDGVANPVPQSPVTCDQPEETVTLVPYAAAKLRITAFPELKI
ncbi:glycoside hydrolase family 127 protein [Alloacidobacterium dinghuense]|uniref:Glycoside hydrolase family 127 protein n=1 Tax=Alloacidobacterium dinghuense TaxID=2763107 RepID=A0A7G8BRN8_9BACT|nr:glycoside hydrolase family 127 protein [Alloacidobacterium dinghuense]